VFTKEVRFQPTSQRHEDSAEALRFYRSVMPVRPGTPHVLAILQPDREYPLNILGLGSA
jgi:hypothetical protein